MPFDSTFDDIYKIGIQEAATQVGILAERLDEQIFIEGMLDRIYRQIELADIIIADMSGKNPNVFYEVGYAHAKDKPCILLTNKADDIPFDLKHRRHIVYNGSLSYLRDELVKSLSWAKNEIENTRRSQIRIEFSKPDATLVVDDVGAYSSLQFIVDLYNDSNNPSSEISAIYLYSGNNWTIFQGGTECPKTEADLPGFKYRAFLAPPVTKLQPKAWAQLQFIATRYLAYKWMGDEIKDTYDVAGSITLRFVTNIGTFDYNYYVNVRPSIYPF
jgi:hypothetical protein